MARDTESTMQWKLDIASLKKGMQDARRQISLANAEFKNAVAGMGKWSDSATGLEAKIRQLNTVYKSQKTMLADLKQQYAIVSAEMGETSPEAQRLKIQIENQEAALKNTSAQIARYNGELADMQEEQAQAQTPMAQLNATIEDQEKAVADLKREYANAIVGDNPEEAARLAGEIESLSTDLAENKQRMADAERAANDLDRSIENAGDAAQEASDGGFTVMKGALADLVSAGVQKAIEGLQRLGEMVIDAGKQAVSGYSDYEQLVGGVETLFGAGGASVEGYAKSVGKSVKDAQGEYDKLMKAQQSVLDNSRKAFESAGMSQNEYMKTVTSFSASLISGLGGDTEAAAKVADMAIIDMADNANKMGTNITDIQNAYQGFAKDNYDMLDNLKLGYGGTQEEAARLINETGVMGESFKATAETVKDVPFDKFIEAIHKVQTEMGITGTTSKEAASTVAGSEATMRAAWDNFLTALGNSEADIGPFWDDLVASVETYAGNLIPVVQDVAERAMTLAIEKMREHFPGFMEFVDTVIPPIKDAFNWIKDNAPMIAASVAGIATALGVLKLQSMGIQGLKAAFLGLQAVQKLVTAAQWLMNAAMNANPIGILVTVIAGLVAAFVTLLATNEDFRKKVIEIWGNVKEFMGNAISAITNFFTVTVPNALKTMLEWFRQLPGKIGGYVSQVLTKIKNWASNMVARAKDTGAKFVNNVITFVKELPGKVWTWLKNVVSKVVSWGTNLAAKGREAAQKLVTKVVDKVKEIPGKVLDVGTDLVKGIWNGISGSLEWIKGKISGWVGNVTSFIKKLFGIKSPSTVMRDQVGKMLAEGIGVGFGDAMPSVLQDMQKSMSGTVDALKSSVDVSANGVASGNVGTFGAAGGTVVGGKVQNITYNQVINSPKALDRLTIYRDTNSLLFSAKVGLKNV